MTEEQLRNLAAGRSVSPAIGINPGAPGTTETTIVTTTAQTVNDCTAPAPTSFVTLDSSKIFGLSGLTVEFVMTNNEEDTRVARFGGSFTEGRASIAGLPLTPIDATDSPGFIVPIGTNPGNNAAAIQNFNLINIGMPVLINNIFVTGPTGAQQTQTITTKSLPWDDNGSTCTRQNLAAVCSPCNNQSATAPYVASYPTRNPIPLDTLHYLEYPVRAGQSGLQFRFDIVGVASAFNYVSVSC